MAHPADHLALVGFYHRCRVAFECVTECIIGCQEKPGVAARCRDRLAGAVCQCPGVVGPMDGVWRASRAGQVGRSRTGGEKDLVLALDDVIDHEGHRGRRHVDDYIDVVNVNPAVATHRYVGDDYVLPQRSRTAPANYCGASCGGLCPTLSNTRRS